MAEQIQWARLSEPTQAIRSLSWTLPAYMYLERVPELWLSDDEAAAGVRFDLLDPQANFSEWERGRVFCSDYELRWEKLDGAYQTVVIGNAPSLNGFALATEVDLDTASVQTHGYLLWGHRVEDEKVSLIGAQHAPNAQIYLELRIPRILRYPVTDKSHQVRLRVREYSDPKSGDLLYCRFVGLEELP